MKSIKRMFILLVAVSLLSVSYAVLADGTFTFATAKDATNTDALRGDDHASGMMHYLMYDQLVAFNPQTFEPAPEIASAWSWSEDGKILTMNLVEGVTFHNEEDLTASDVVFSFERILDPENASPQRGNYAWLISIDALDDYTVQFTLEYPFVAALEFISLVMIVPEETIQEIGQEAFELHPIGSGPFKFVEWIKGERYVLERNDDYWMKTPLIERVVMRPIPELSVQALELETGGIDMVYEMAPTDYLRLQSSDDVTTMSADGFSYTYFSFNLSRSPMNDARFRQAVVYALDLDGATSALFPGGTASRAYGQLPKQSWANADEYLQGKVTLSQDLDKARDLRSELIEDGVIDEDQVFTIWTPTDDVRTSLGTILATAMQQVGFRVEVKPTEWGTYIPVLLRQGNPEGEWDIMILSYTGLFDPDYTLYKVWHSSHAFPGTNSNLHMYMNEDVDALLDQARRAGDQVVRRALYQEAQEIALSSYSVVPVYIARVMQATTNRVHDFILDPRSFIGLCNQWTNVWLDE